MPWVWYPLPKPDERAVMLRETCRLDQHPDWLVAKPRLDLGSEHCRVRILTLPCANCHLMRRILTAAGPGGPSAVGWVSLLGAQSGEYGRRVVSTLLSMLRPSLGAAGFAVALSPIGQVRAAVATGVRQDRRRRLGFRVSAPGCSDVPGRVVLSAGERCAVRCAGCPAG